MLPNVITIGAAKCGTTSLHLYLDCHPEISMSKTKELNFFSGGSWDQGVQWYESQFANGVKIVGESTTNYAKYPLFKDVPEKMSSVVPDTKLIYVVRDPIERMVSHYMDNISHRTEDRPFDECLKDPESESIFFCSQYYMQIERYLKFYDKSQILIIPLEDLRDKRLETMKQIFGFLEIDDAFSSDRFSKMFNQSTEKRKKNLLGQAIKQLGITNRIRPFLPKFMINLYGATAGTPIQRPQLEGKEKDRLIEMLKPDTEKLREFSQLEFEGWCI